MDAATEVQAFKATVTQRINNSAVMFTTYVSARTAKQARQILESEGTHVVELFVLEQVPA
jgi:hypothetical protein